MTIRMRASHALSAALLCVLAAGCSPAPDAPPAADAPPTTGAEAGKTFIGRQAAKAIAKAGQALQAENLDIGDGFAITIDGRSYGGGQDAKGLPKAELTPDGELLIEGKAVPTTPEQRALLVAHRRHLEGVALAGLAIGAQGADVAGTALTGIGDALFGGDAGRQAYEARIEAEADRIKDEALKLCALLPALYDSQQSLAGALPAFAPYATMTPRDIEDCGNHAGDDAPAADAGETITA
ncbi:hypothetical protein WCE41_05950 [Luteimonas sp. MJ246]|uniref:hypothetical protein n=1 Tax=Luteimonas sp. MJ174 TaxID=3129237 RepID=UPI0031BBB9C4